MKKSKPKKSKKVSTKKTSTKSKEKLIGNIDHVFEKIGVITTTLKAPLKVGDVIRIKGTTTNFLQEVESMQINHKNVLKAKKGDGVGIKVNQKVRDNDKIYLPSKKEIAEFKKSKNSISTPTFLLEKNIPITSSISKPIPKQQNFVNTNTTTNNPSKPVQQQKPQNPTFLTF